MFRDSNVSIFMLVIVMLVILMLGIVMLVIVMIVIVMLVTAVLVTGWCNHAHPGIQDAAKSSTSGEVFS